MTSPLLLVAGNGPVTEAIAPMAELLGWTPVVVDDLAAFEKALPGATGVVVLSHDDGLDGPALAAALAAAPPYVGAMGSRRTQERRRTWLAEHGVPVEAQAPIHGPAGLDIGADGPPEIALSILAELVAVVRGRTVPGSLADRDGPIHPELAPGEAFCPGG